MAKLGKPIRNVIRGDSRQIRCVFLESDNSTPIDLSGGTVYFTVNSDSDPDSDSSVALQKSATSFTDATNGTHTFTLSSSDTEIDAGDYWYDSEFIDTTGAKLSAYRGKFEVQSDITRT